MKRRRPIVSVAELRKHLGSRAPVETSMEADGLALSDARVPDGAEITLVGELESISEGVVLTATVSVPWSATCRRCLGDVAGTAAVEVREIFETVPTDGDTWPIDGDQLDLEPLLRDTALLALPLAPLCSEDCAGPAPEQFPTGPATDSDEDNGTEARRDPRWGALDEISFE